MKKSAGILLFRIHNKVLEVLLIHPGGPYWANKDLHAWSIPKGEIGEYELPFEAAKRELKEETGIEACGDFIELARVKLKSNKWIYAWAQEAEFDTRKQISNHFEMEWPPHSGILVSYTEADQARWFPIEQAIIKINSGQIPLLEELKSKLNNRVISD